MQRLWDDIGDQLVKVPGLLLCVLLAMAQHLLHHGIILESGRALILKRTNLPKSVLSSSTPCFQPSLDLIILTSGLFLALRRTLRAEIGQ